MYDEDRLEAREAPESARSMAMHRLDKEIERLHAAIEQLGNRLSAVLAPERTERDPSAQVAEVETGESMHVQDIHRFRGKVESARRQVEEILTRCEV